MSRPDHFMGYYRKDGKVGIRNHVIAIANCSCAIGVVDQICKAVPELVPLRHTDGCSAPGDDADWLRTLKGVCCNPNIYAVILVGVGCETYDAKEVGKQIEELTPGKPIYATIVQDDGGGQQVIKDSIAKAKEFLAAAAKEERKPAPFSKLIFGTECGGSDGLSGVTANPTIGFVSDWVIGQGGAAILTEIPELIGCEDDLAERSITPEVGEKVKNLIYEWEEKRLRPILGPMASRTLARGNMNGGLTTIQEKAQGCVHKGGTTTVMDVIKYGEQLNDRKGLYIMDGPGYDTDSITGIFASGAQVIMFSTGRGNPLGFPVAPVIKVCSNTRTYNNVGGKDGDMDINAGQIITDGVSPAEVHEYAVDYLIETLNGRLTQPEKYGYGGALCIWSQFSPF